MLLKPRTPCTLISYGDTTTVYGERVPGARRDGLCTVLRLKNTEQPTSVRADSSASRGAAREMVADVRLLVAPTLKARIGDQLVVGHPFPETYRVIESQPRYDINGRLDHYELQVMFWSAR